MRVLGRVPGDDVGRFLLDAYARLSAGARGEALNALFRSESRMQLLLDAVEAGDVSRSALGWNRRVRLMRDTEGAVKARARSLLRAPDASRVSVMHAYEAALDVSGDAGRGQAVYFSVCARCHGFAGSEDTGSAVFFRPRPGDCPALVAPGASGSDPCPGEDDCGWLRTLEVGAPERCAGYGRFACGNPFFRNAGHGRRPRGGSAARGDRNVAAGRCIPDADWSRGGNRYTGDGRSPGVFAKIRVATLRLPAPHAWRLHS